MSRSSTKFQKELTLSDAVRMFVTHHAVEGKSPLTIIDWYKRRLGRFILYTGDIPVRELNLEHGQRFVLHLSKRNKYADHPKQKERQEPIGRATLRKYVRAIRAFANYLDAEGLTKENVFKRLKSPKDEKRVVEVLSDEEIQELLLNLDGEPITVQSIMQAVKRLGVRAGVPRVHVVLRQPVGITVIVGCYGNDFVARRQDR